MKLVVDSLADIPEVLHGEYEQKDGKFVLKLEGEYPPLKEANAKIVEFRNNNINLMKELDTLRPLKEKFEGLDPDEARSAIAKVKELGKKGIKDSDDFEARVRAQVEELVKPLKEQVAAYEQTAAAERKRADDFLFRTKIGDEFVKMGGKPNALDYVVNMARDIFEVKESSIAAKTGKFSTEKPGDPLSIGEWLAGIQKEHDYVFQPSGGGGTPPKGGGPAPKSGLKPGQTLLKNPSPQQLGEYAKDIAAGKIKVEFDEEATV